MCAPNERVGLVTPDARRKSTCCSRYPCCVAILALVLAVLVLAAILDAATASQAWFRERVRRFLEEGADPAF